MELQEIKSLIEIKQYLETAVNNYTIPKANIKELQQLILLIDKKIIEQIQDSNEFVNLEGMDIQ